MKAINIIWDVDFEEDLENLPTEIDIPNDMTDKDEIADYITDITGFCHSGFELEGYFEAVEVCPHCMSENTYPMWNTEVSGFVAVCEYCGKEIFLCDECQHTILQDGEVHDCDWCKTECGGKCHRGTTRD